MREGAFEDMKAKRDCLQCHAFPWRPKLCEENDARFQAIDLRWGPRDDVALDQETAQISPREVTNPFMVRGGLCPRRSLPEVGLPFVPPAYYPGGRSFHARVID